MSNYEAESYYNSGVLLMNLPQMREEMRPADIFAYAREYEERLILPDQDILNGLYGTRILGVDDSVWNYDARRYDRYWLGSHGEKDMDWVMDHTVSVSYTHLREHERFHGRRGLLRRGFLREKGGD